MRKIQLTIAINFISSKSNDEECVIHSKSDKKEIVINDIVDKVVEELFKSLFYRYQNNLEKLTKDSKFLFDYTYLLYYKCHSINSNCGRFKQIEGIFSKDMLSDLILIN